MNPWVSAWLSPRATIRHVVAENPNRALWWLAAVYGFSSLLNAFQSLMLGLTLPVVGILALAALLSPLWGYVFFSLWGWVVTLTGKWLKGQGHFKQVRAAYAWSCVPLLVNIPLWFLLAFYFGAPLFSNFAETHVLTSAQVSMLFLVLIIRIAAAVWSLIVYIHMLAEVQQFSILRSIGNIVIASVVIAVISLIFFYVLGSVVQPSANVVLNSLRML
jgi:hypothetical protein